MLPTPSHCSTPENDAGAECCKARSAWKVVLGAENVGVCSSPGYANIANNCVDLKRLTMLEPKACDNVGVDFMTMSGSRLFSHSSETSTSTQDPVQLNFLS